ncbi:MAG TPA: prepilin peptidase [Candidatus Absconditabacterales bacterium]|nr:prepilin peptidase [Candidatus Absconditabacterales bacterium]
MQITNIILLFVLGAIFGSFGGVLISRKWDKEGIKSIFFGRSKCTNCNKTLGFFELFPILSFFFQKGKCKKCGKKMSNFYWILELLSGLIFVATYVLIPYTSIFELIFWLIVNWGFLLLLIFDIQRHELHIPIWIFVSILALVFAGFSLDITIFLETTILYVIIFFLIYLFSKYYMRIRFRKKEEGFGQGDVYLSLTIGALSGFVFYYNSVQFGVTNLIDMLLIYVILSSVIGLIYALVNRFLFSGHKQIIPFLPSMILAFWILLLYGDIFINIFK